MIARVAGSAVTSKPSRRKVLRHELATATTTTTSTG